MFKKPVEKEMKMQMLFDTKEKAEKGAYKFGCKDAHRMRDKDAMQYAQT